LAIAGRTGAEGDRPADGGLMRRGGLVGIYERARARIDHVPPEWAWAGEVGAAVHGAGRSTVALHDGEGSAGDGGLTPWYKWRVREAWRQRRTKRWSRVRGAMRRSRTENGCAEQGGQKRSGKALRAGAVVSGQHANEQAGAEQRVRGARSLLRRAGAVCRRCTPGRGNVNGAQSVGGPGRKCR